jgi:hypothetical protein
MSYILEYHSLYMLSQHDRLLEVLKRRGSAGVTVREMQAPRPEGLGLAQYNARINELRGEGHDIENVRKEYRYILHKPNEQQSLF